METERELELKLEIMHAEISLENAKRERLLVEVERERVALRRQRLIVQAEKTKSQGSAGGPQSQRRHVRVDEGTAQRRKRPASPRRESNDSALEEEDDENHAVDDEHDMEESTPSPSDVPLRVFVKTLTGKTLCFTATGEWVIQRLKKEIETIEGPPCDQQRLIFRGTQLEDDRSLHYYGVQQDDVLHLILRLRGC